MDDDNAAAALEEGFEVEPVRRGNRAGLGGVYHQHVGGRQLLGRRERGGPLRLRPAGVEQVGPLFEEAGVVVLGARAFSLART